MLTKVLSILTVGCFGLAGLFHVLEPTAPVSPKLDIIARPEPVALGEVDQGEEIPFTLRVKNTTARPISIVDLATSCGCTRVDPVAGRSIEPGVTLAVSGLLDTDGRRGVMNSSAILTYRTPPSGPDRKAILSVGAFVRPTLRIEPETLTFHLVANSSKPIVQTVAIDSAKLASFTIHDPGVSVPWITAEIEESKVCEVARPARLKVTLDPVALPADYLDSPAPTMQVRVRTTSEREPILIIPVLIRKP